MEGRRDVTSTPSPCSFHVSAALADGNTQHSKHPSSQPRKGADVLNSCRFRRRRHLKRSVGQSPLHHVFAQKLRFVPGFVPGQSSCSQVVALKPCSEQKLLQQVHERTRLRSPWVCFARRSLHHTGLPGSAQSHTARAASVHMFPSRFSPFPRGERLGTSAPDPTESCGSGFICCYCCFQVEN